MKRQIWFYSEGIKLCGDIYVPDDLPPEERRAGVVMAQGYFGIKDQWLPNNAKAFNQAGYVAMVFDYKGWGMSEGPKGRLDPYGRVADFQAAMTALSLQPEVLSDGIGLYGTSYAGGTVAWVGAVDARAKCIVCVGGVFNGTLWLREQGTRSQSEWDELLGLSKTDREHRVKTGESELVHWNRIMVSNAEDVALGEQLRGDVPGLVIDTIPLDYVDETVGFNAEWIADRISPTPFLLIHMDNDRLVPLQESERMHAQAKEPKKLVILNGFTHYDVYREPAFSQVMKETLEWFGKYLPAHPEG